VNNYRKREKRGEINRKQWKWRRKNKESRRWIKIRKAVLSLREEGGWGGLYIDAVGALP